MKKIFIACGMLFLSGFLHAAIPLDQNPQTPQEANWNTPLLGNSTGFLTLASVSKASGSSTYLGKNCITNLIVSLATNATFYLLDGNTTSYYIYGGALGSSGTNTIQISRDALRPICGTSGNSMTLNVQPASTGEDVVDYEGYTWLPIMNAGQ